MCFRSASSAGGLGSSHRSGGKGICGSNPERLRVVPRRPHAPGKHPNCDRKEECAGKDPEMATCRACGPIGQFKHGFRPAQRRGASDGQWLT